MAGHCGVVVVRAHMLMLLLACLLAATSGLDVSHGHHANTHSTANWYRYDPEAAIAIDLGNTNSCVAGYTRGGPGETETMFRVCIPSWVAFPDDGSVLVGEAAKNHADTHPEAAIFGFKRMLGLRYEEDTVQGLTERVPYKIGSTKYGIGPVIQLDAKDDGGYFDVLAYRDDPFLGGDDFDRRVVDHFVDVIKMKHGKDVSEDRAALRKLGVACERAKKVLSSQDHAQVSSESLLGGSMDFSESLSRRTFEKLSGDLFWKIIALVDSAMADSELERSEIDEVILVGGSTMIPKIQRLVKDYFKGPFGCGRLKPGFIPANKSLYKLSNNSGQDFFRGVIPGKANGPLWEGAKHKGQTR